jgi:hypothetical protein
MLEQASSMKVIFRCARSMLVKKLIRTVAPLPIAFAHCQILRRARHIALPMLPDIIIVQPFQCVIHTSSDVQHRSGG